MNKKSFQKNLYQLAHAVEVLRFVDEPGTRMSVNTGANPIQLFTVVTDFS